MKDLLNKLYALRGNAKQLTNLTRDLIYQLEHEIGERKFYYVCFFCHKVVKEEWIKLDEKTEFGGTYEYFVRFTLDTMCDKCKQDPEKVKLYKLTIDY